MPILELVNEEILYSNSYHPSVEEDGTEVIQEERNILDEVWEKVDNHPDVSFTSITHFNTSIDRGRNFLSKYTTRQLNMMVWR